MAGLLATCQMACGGGGGGGPLPPPPAVDVSAVAANDPGSTLPATWKNGAIAEIYVRGYKDSNGDGIGDLPGLTQSLDYLKDLGITGIWLMPVTQSLDRDHGYAVANYRSIESDYGTLADFDELLRQAHLRGIGVVIDYVINHSASSNALFLNSDNSATNTYRDWYVWQNNAPSGWNVFGSNPWYLGSAGAAYFAAFTRTMPDFNLRKAEVVSYHHDNLRLWLNRGVDGFRFDAVGNLVENGPNGSTPGSGWESQPENHVVMNGVRQVVAGYTNRYMVCESPAAPLLFGAASSCGSAFAFGLQSDVVNAARGNTAAISRVSAYFSAAPVGMASFISNHDSFAGDRLWDQAGGDNAVYRLAAATNLLQGTTPFIYYGEEIGMAGASSLTGDPRLRTPMSWSSNNIASSNVDPAGFSTRAGFRANSANVASNNVVAQQGNANSLLNYYKQVIALRTSRPSLMQGNHAGATASGTVMSFRREVTTGATTERTLVVFNYGAAAATANVSGLPSSAALRRLWPVGAAGAAADASGAALIGVPAQSFAVFAVE